MDHGVKYGYVAFRTWSVGMESKSSMSFCNRLVGSRALKGPSRYLLMMSKGHDQFKSHVQVFMLEAFQDGIGV